MPLKVYANGENSVIVDYNAGSGYVIIGGNNDGVASYAPAKIGGISYINDYRYQANVIIDDVLTNGRIIKVIPTFAYQDIFSKIPLLEVNYKDGTLSEYLIRNGLAVPNNDIINKLPRKEFMINALREARLKKNGYWSEYTAESKVSTILSKDLDLITKPVIKEDSLSSAGIIVLFICILSILFRDSKFNTGKENLFQKSLRLITPFNKNSFKSAPDIEPIDNDIITDGLSIKTKEFSQYNEAVIDAHEIEIDKNGNNEVKDMNTDNKNNIEENSSNNKM